MRPTPSKPSSPAILVAVVPLFACLLACSRVQPQAAAQPPQAPPIEFAGQWGVQGDDPGQLSDPVGPALDVFGRVYFVNRGNGTVQKFEPSGAPLLAFDAAGARRATAVAVDSGGGIYVANAATGEMRIYFPEGDFLRSFLFAPQRKLDGPFSFDIADDGTVFVPDPALGRIQAFSGRGRLVRTWKVAPAPGARASKPSIVAAGPDGFLYVVDSAANRIVKFTRDGTQVAAWDDAPDGDQPILALAVSSKTVFALRGAPPRLVVWTLDGQRQLADNLDGRLDAALPNEGALIVTPAGELIVLVPSGPRVLRFRIHL